MIRLKQIITCCLPFVVIVVVIACRLHKPGFVIEGHVDSPQEGTMLLITPDATDTLGMAPIVNGHFRITGSVDSIVEAALIPQGDMMGSLPFFLENSENPFDVYFNRTDNAFSSKVTGGGVQDIAAKFYSISVGFRDRMNMVVKQLWKAQQEGTREDVERVAQRYRRLKMDARAGEDSMLNVYKDSYVAAYVLFTRSKHDPDLLREESRLLGPNAWNTTYGRHIKSMLTQYEKLKAGEPAPDFFAYTPEGKRLSLYEVGGKVKVLHFWGSWCANCRKESVKLEKLYGEFHDKGLEIIGFSMDPSREKWLEALEQARLPWIQLIDTENEGKATDLYVVASVPNTLLLDENNRIIGRNLQDEVLREEVRKRLEK